MDNLSLEKRLESYTIKCPQELLIVTYLLSEEEEIITIYKGFSSSLTRGTSFDPDIPILPAEARIISIDRVKSPYQPDNPTYLAQGLTVAEMEILLEKLGI